MGRLVLLWLLGALTWKHCKVFGEDIVNDGVENLGPIDDGTVREDGVSPELDSRGAVSLPGYEEQQDGDFEDLEVSTSSSEEVSSESDTHGDKKGLGPFQGVSEGDAVFRGGDDGVMGQDGGLESSIEETDDDKDGEELKNGFVMGGEMDRMHFEVGGPFGEDSSSDSQKNSGKQSKLADMVSNSERRQRLAGAYKNNPTQRLSYIMERSQDESKNSFPLVVEDSEQEVQRTIKQLKRSHRITRGIQGFIGVGLLALGGAGIYGIVTVAHTKSMKKKVERGRAARWSQKPPLIKSEQLYTNEELMLEDKVLKDSQGHMIFDSEAAKAAIVTGVNRIREAFKLGLVRDDPKLGEANKLGISSAVEGIGEGNLVNMTTDKLIKKEKLKELGYLDQGTMVMVSGIRQHRLNAVVAYMLNRLMENEENYGILLDPNMENIGVNFEEHPSKDGSVVGLSITMALPRKSKVEGVAKTGMKAEVKNLLAPSPGIIKYPVGQVGGELNKVSQIDQSWGRPHVTAAV